MKQDISILHNKQRCLRDDILFGTNYYDNIPNVPIICCEPLQRVVSHRCKILSPTVPADGRIKNGAVMTDDDIRRVVGPCFILL